MWGAISRLFHKNEDGRTDEAALTMDKKRSHDPPDQDTYETRQAKQRATLKWILSKAFNNRVPDNLREPFYKDHEEQEHLKPQLVHYLANAEMYCLALANIYSDPNYNNLNHCGVLQALARKGVYISDPIITETTLIQTTPIKLSAHQVVMQAVMTVYAKEVGSGELILGAVRRFLPAEVPPPSEPPADHEQALLLWINQATVALKLRTDREESGAGKCPEFPKVHQLQDLCDGASLAGVVSFYSPEELHWSAIKVSHVPTVSDCVRNLTLVSDFCSTALPYNIFHMAPEDVYYLRGSMRHNLVVFLADLFNLLEIHPAKCVTLNSATTNNTNAEGRNSHGVGHKRCLPQAVSAIPDLRAGLDAPSSFSGSPIITSGNQKKPHFTQQTDIQFEAKNGGDEFVVHRGKGIPTLSSVFHHGGGGDAGSPVRHQPEAAGKPTNWDSNKKQTYAGRRSRRNSLSEDSQLTLENFGGSQENLHLLGRNPDKEPAVHTGKREISARSSVLDNNSSALHSALHETYTLQQQQQQQENVAVRTSLSRNNSFIESQRRAEETRSSAGLQQTLLDPSPPLTPTEIRPPEREKKVTTFAALPNNTTTWQQQSLSSQSTEQQDNGVSSSSSEVGDGGVMGSQLMNIRLKLEEKRRRIEGEKRRMEAHMNKQRQKLGKAAFLQAVSKGKVDKSPESDPGVPHKSTSSDTTPPLSTDKPARPFSLQDINEVEQKWLRGDGFTEERKTPDLDNMDIESYQQSIAQMNSSLHEIQADLQRLANQQNQIKSGQEMGPPPQMQSFASLHHQQQKANFGGGGPQLINYSGGGGGGGINFIEQHHYDQMSAGYHNGRVGPPPQSGGFTLNHHQSPQQQQLMHHHQMAPQQQHQQMHSLMSNQPPPNNQQQWHSLNQQQHNYNYQTRFSQGFSLHGGNAGANNYHQENFMGRESPQHLLHQQQPPTMMVGPQHQPPPPSGSGGGGGEFYLHEPHTQRRNWGQPYAPDANAWSNTVTRREPVSLSSSPKQQAPIHQQQLMQNGGGGSSDSGGYRTSPPSLAPTPPPRASVNHAPIPTPPVDDMEPQSISFIGSGDDELSSGLSRLNITSGNRTYRIPSPTRPHPRNSLPQEKADQGFYISFDDDTPPKRPKPPLRTKRASPKKERALTQVLETSSVQHLLSGMSEGEINKPRLVHSPPPRVVRSPVLSQLPTASSIDHVDARVPPTHDSPTGVGIVIGGQPDPVLLDEMERKKEKILIMSLQRRQAAEEARNHKEAEAVRRRDQEKAKEEEKLRKKEEEKRRRAVILEQYKIKKAIEEAEREGKQVDKELLNSLKAGLQNSGGGGGTGGSGGSGPVPKLRGKAGQVPRPRPKTIHIDSGSAHDAHDGTITPSRGKKGSSSNLSVFGSPMRRDYYRGSQDCLTETRKPSPRSLYSEMGDESRGTSPGRSLGRRASYKTSRDASPDVRMLGGRSKFGTYQAHRKSNSLMNLTGSSCDQDSVAYRYGDTDSGLGRATPRAPSPSGPGSLPARRRFDDSVSDTGSDYSGPRLYRQPTTKSNKGIVLNAVEYCVFPGVVNREAKRRVLDEINRSEAKHFLVLFRDAGCQFRALYAYYPETEEVTKLYGTGPKQVTDRMFDKFFKYNSGGKCFSQVHTKHLTVTIDAFTIHNSLWQGKKVNLPNKRDMTLVI